MDANNMTLISMMSTKELASQEVANLRGKSEGMDEAMHSSDTHKVFQERK
jgi:hypothetical protein